MFSCDQCDAKYTTKAGVVNTRGNLINKWIKIAAIFCCAGSHDNKLNKVNKGEIRNTFICSLFFSLTIHSFYPWFFFVFKEALYFYSLRQNICSFCNISGLAFIFGMHYITWSGYIANTKIFLTKSTLKTTLTLRRPCLPTSPRYIRAFVTSVINVTSHSPIDPTWNDTKR